jgi:hypothetical protein
LAKSGRAEASFDKSGRIPVVAELGIFGTNFQNVGHQICSGLEYLVHASL